MRKWIMVCAVAAVAVVAITVVLTPAHAAAPACAPVAGFGETAVVFDPKCDPDKADGVFVGMGIISIAGEDFEVALETILLGPPVEGDDGTLHAVTSHTFVFNDEDSFTTIDRAVLEPAGPPGLFRLNSSMRIISGTGVFEDARGRLHAHGQVDFFDEDNGIGFPCFGEASFDIRGVVCD